MSPSGACRCDGAGVRVVTVCWTQCWSYVVPGQASLHGTARPPWPHAAMPWPLYTQSHSLDNWQPKQRRSLGQNVLRILSFALAYSFSLLSSQASYWLSLPDLRAASGQTWLHSLLWSWLLPGGRRLPVLSRGSQFITTLGCSGHGGYQGYWGMLLPSHDTQHHQANNNYNNTSCSQKN